MRLRSTAILAVVAALALVVGACGGDDNKDSNQGVTLGNEATQPPTGTTAPATAESGSDRKKKSSSRKRSKKKERSSNAGSGSQGAQQNDNRPTQKQKELASALKDASSKEQQDKVSYVAARGVCAERPLKEIKKLYKPKGDSDQEVATAVAKFYNPKHRRDAAYDGCLAGLKSR